MLSLASVVFTIATILFYLWVFFPPSNQGVSDNPKVSPELFSITYMLTGLSFEVLAITKIAKKYLKKGSIFIIGNHSAVQGSGQGLLPPRRFLPLHQPPGDDLT